MPKAVRNVEMQCEENVKVKCEQEEEQCMYM